MSSDPTPPDQGDVDGGGPADGDGRVTAGVLAADSTTRGDMTRRRRWLVGGAVLGVVVVLAFVLGATLAADLARDRARADAALAEAESSFATAVVGRAEDYERPALQVRIDAPVLQTALEDHLVVTERTPDQLATAVQRTTTSLAAVAEELDELVARDVPVADPLVDADARDAVLVDLEQLRVDATALVEELRATVPTVAPWTAAVTRVDAALAAHTAAVEERPASDDPAELVEGWRSELDPLQTLARRARRAADVPGLEQWARAHLRYARDTRGFITEAVALLRDGSLDEYNELFLATYGTDDPFGFQAAARSGAVTAIESDPVTAVAALNERAAVVVDAVAEVEQTVVDELGEDA